MKPHVARLLAAALDRVVILEEIEKTIASELEEGQRLAVSLLKDITGGESIKADRKYEHEIEFQPAHKVWLTGNHKPLITDTTLSIWRRMKLIPSNITIPADEVDVELPEKLDVSARIK